MKTSRLKSTLFIISLFVSATCISQNRLISGGVINKENHEPLPFVNIGIANKTVGTVSNADGLFKLDLTKKIAENDTVTFSYIGFRTERKTISELREEQNKIILSPEATALDEVFVISKKIKLRPKKIGRAAKGLGLTHMNFYTYDEKGVDDRLSKERGMKFKIRRNCHLKDLNFNITSNDFTSLKFRVNFYRVDDGLPGVLLVRKNIVFKIEDNFIGWFKVDLEPYKIYLKEEVEEVAVTIQWLESVKKDDKSKYFSISTAASPLHTAYFREKAMDKWTTGGQSLSFYLNAMCD